MTNDPGTGCQVADYALPRWSRRTRIEDWITFGWAGTHGAQLGAVLRDPHPRHVGVTDVAEKPRLLVIDRDSTHGKSTLDCLAGSFELVTARTISKALSLLRDQAFAAVYVDASQRSAIRWVGMMIQAEEILDAIADGVAVVDPDLRIIWTNPEFLSLTQSSTPVIGSPFYKGLDDP